MMKKKNQVLVSLSIVALLGGCSEEQVQRDVYNSLEDCLADWQKIELCEADQSNENNSEWSEDNQTVKQTLNPDGATHSGNSSGSEGASHTSSATGEGHGSMGSAIAGAAMGYMIARTMGSFLGPSYNPSNRAVSTPTGQVIQPQTNRSVGKPVLVKGNAGSTYSKPVSRGGFKSSNSSSSRSSGG
jgi:uncharacterized protein YgiB involved in biofilm formation